MEAVRTTEEEEKEQEDFARIVKDFLAGLGLELPPEEPVIDARRFRRLPRPQTPKEMRQRTTMRVTRYTLSQVRARCPPAMTTDMFLRLLLFLYETAVNKGILLNLEQDKANEVAVAEPSHRRL